MQETPGADVVVPVAGAAEDFQSCAASLLRHTGFSRRRLVVVLDGPQPAGVTETTRRIAEEIGGRLEVIQVPSRRGFPHAANLGFSASERDVALVNSDVVVTPGWLSRLEAAADGAGRNVGTVTPFSNHATIASLPVFLHENLLPAGHDPDSFAGLVESVSARAYPLLPTGVGSCLLVRRALLKEVGPFDEEAFGEGYGEENDLCRRGRRAGFVDVLDDATFVYHRGGASFDPGLRRRLQRRAHLVMRRRHPGYLEEVERFIREDPLRPLRERVLRALRRLDRPIPTDGIPRMPRRTPPSPSRTWPARVLHVVHGWPPFASGGTEVYARGLALRQAERREVTVFARLADARRSKGDRVELLDGGARVQLFVNNFDQRDPVSRNALHDAAANAALAELLEEARPELIHVHHLAGHGATLMSVAASRGVPIVYQLQDWFATCARANLMDARRRPCPGPSPLRCQRCLPFTRLPPAAVLGPALYVLRRALHVRALEAASLLVAGSHAALRDLSERGALPPGPRTAVVPYGVDVVRPPGARRPARLPLRFGMIGSVLPHKGAHVAVEAFAPIPKEAARLEIWGDRSVSPAYAAELERLSGAADVRFMGTFTEGGKGALLGSLDVLLAPSIGLESYSLAAHEAMAAGTPVLASSSGAFPERVPEGAGELLPPGDVPAWRSAIRRLVETPARIDAWARALPRVPTADDHAAEIEALYESLLTRRCAP